MAPPAFFSTADNTASAPKAIIKVATEPRMAAPGVNMDVLATFIVAKDASMAAPSAAVGIINNPWPANGTL